MNFLKRTWAEIDLSALIHNFNLIKTTASPSKVMAIVKANGYGHSVVDIAPVLEKNGADFFGVSNIDEALKLRTCGITKPILILGYTPAEMAKSLAENNISQCVYSKDYAELLSNEAAKADVNIKIHLKLDTGMSRLGFNCRNDNLKGIEDALYSCKLPHFITEGVFTHFAVSDRDTETEDGFTDQQFARFTKAINYLESQGINFEVKHCCNSAATLLDKKKHLDLVRPGVILYGLSPSGKEELKKDFIPVMTLKSVVSMVKKISAGDTVSYGRTFTADKDMTIATVTAGYGDGYPRLLSNKGSVIINGQRAPIVGRVCMDQFMVDVTDVDGVEYGDKVTLIGFDGDEHIPVEELGDIADRFSYEFVCDLGKRIPREFIRHGKVIEQMDYFL